MFTINNVKLLFDSTVAGAEFVNDLPHVIPVLPHVILVPPLHVMQDRPPAVVIILHQLNVGITQGVEYVIVFYYFHSWIGLEIYFVIQLLVNLLLKCLLYFYFFCYEVGTILNVFIMLPAYSEVDLFLPVIGSIVERDHTHVLQLITAQGATVELLIEAKVTVGAEVEARHQDVTGAQAEAEAEARVLDGKSTPENPMETGPPVTELY